MKVNKTFSIDLELIHELKKLRNRNGGLRNKSAYVNAAIWTRLNSDDAPSTILDTPTRQLMAALHNRDDCDQFVKRVLLQVLSRTSNEHPVSDKKSLSS